MRPYRWFAMIGTALLAACQEPTVPSAPLEGVYVLRTIGPAAVPAVTDVVLDVEFSMLADTVVLRADGTGEHRRRTARRNLTTGARDSSSTVLSFDQERSGNRLRATNITCEPLCDALPDVKEFVLDGTWLRVGPAAFAYRYEQIVTGGLH